MTPNLDQITNSNLPLLGHTVIWQVQGVKIPHPELVQRLHHADPEFANHAPSKPTYKKALKSAIEDWLKEEKNGNGNKTLIRKINKRLADWMVYALVLEETDYQALGLHHATEVRILLKKEDGEFIVTTTALGDISAEEEAKAIKAKLLPHYEKYKDIIDSAALSRVMVKIVATLDSVSLRKGGGVYFVPDSQTARLEKLQQLIGSLGSSTLLAIPIPDIDSARVQMANAVHHSVMDELEILRSDLKRFQEESTVVRQATITKRLEQYNQVAQRTAIYTNLLNMRNQEIKDQLDQLRKTAQSLVLPQAPSEPDF